MKEITLFGKNVMIEQVKKDSIVQLHLPENMKDETKHAMFDLVVTAVGDEVTRVAAGDIVMAHCPPSCAQVNPATGKVVIVIQESMIQGVLSDDGVDASEEFQAGSGLVE